MAQAEGAAKPKTLSQACTWCVGTAGGPGSGAGRRGPLGRDLASTK